MWLFNEVVSQEEASPRNDSTLSLHLQEQRMPARENMMSLSAGRQAQAGRHNLLPRDQDQLTTGVMHGTSAAGSKKKAGHAWQRCFAFQSSSPWPPNSPTHAPPAHRSISLTPGIDRQPMSSSFPNTKFLACQISSIARNGPFCFSGVGANQRLCKSENMKLFLRSWCRLVGCRDIAGEDVWGEAASRRWRESLRACNGSGSDGVRWGIVCRVSSWTCVRWASCSIATLYQRASKSGFRST